MRLLRDIARFALLLPLCLYWLFCDTWDWDPEDDDEALI